MLLKSSSIFRALTEVSKYRETVISIALAIVFGLTFTSHGTSKHAAFIAEKAYAMGAHAGISIIYFPQQHKLYPILITNLIITIGLFGEDRYVYQYVIIPAYFLFFSFLSYAKYTEKIK